MSPTDFIVFALLGFTALAGGNIILWYVAKNTEKAELNKKGQISIVFLSIMVYIVYLLILSQFYGTR